MRHCFVPFIFFFFLNCSIKSPEFTITGQKTALEQQVLGSYQHLTDNAIVTTSARSAGDGTEKEGVQQQVILQAVQNQKFNRDEINELKQEKVVGENNRGYLEILPTSKYEQDERYTTLVDKLVDEENRDRRIIYQRVLVMNRLAREEETGSIFADMQIEQSAPGTMVQLHSGQWIEKADDSK